ncbi:hypothetical protein HID58_002331 [Brassica napus]|uniref:BnaAnng03580D protein n=3 Tax=Brassica TaxID=3705 RepID=A0A078GW47_BRANA|nr:hypothetical protein HID58_002331 [Brassica napus]CAF2152145.1 unnamed protein product [Brassica napus]CAG7888721.1 unnamed protein product [Brassica rapa]CDY29736.1 BnaAnng03580D [Brassica napus]VDC76094.1 unnamed protein product [Brassica rapa]
MFLHSAYSVVVSIESMTVPKRYVLRLFMSIKYITANVVDKNNGRVVTTASTVEHAVKNSLECGRTCSAKAAAILEEVLAMRLKVEGHQDGQGRGIHVDVKKEIEKKGFKSRTKDKYYRYCSDEGHQ